MEEKTRNLCAQIPASLHSRVRQEQERSGKTLSQYITKLLTDYYEGSKNTMDANIKTIAIQVPEELFNRLKTHLEAESKRTGKRVTQRDFIIGLIEDALNGASEED